MNWQESAGHDEQNVQKQNDQGEVKKNLFLYKIISHHKKQQKTNNAQSIIPLTIRGIYSAFEDGGKFLIDNDTEIHQLSLIAEIISSNIENNLHLELDDGTGTIEANMYNEEDISYYSWCQ